MKTRRIFQSFFFAIMITILSSIIIGCKKDESVIDKLISITENGYKATDNTLREYDEYNEKDNEYIWHDFELINNLKGELNIYFDPRDSMFVWITDSSLDDIMNFLDKEYSEHEDISDISTMDKNIIYKLNNKTNDGKHKYISAYSNGGKSCVAYEYSNIIDDSYESNINAKEKLINQE